MIETYMRPYFEPVLNSTGRIFKPLKPDIITLFSFILGSLASLFLAYKYIYISLLCLWLSGLADCLDGIVARLRKEASAWGTYADLIADRLVESALMIGFSFFVPKYHLVYLLFMCALLFHFSTFALSATLFENKSHKSVHYAPSVIERIDVFFVMSAMMLWPQTIPYLGYSMNLVIILSAMNRLYQAFMFCRKLTPSRATSNQN